LRNAFELALLLVPAERHFVEITQHQRRALIAAKDRFGNRRRQKCRSDRPADDFGVQIDGTRKGLGRIIGAVG
jgi:hypothetical protein